MTNYVVNTRDKLLIVGDRDIEDICQEVYMNYEKQ